MAGVFPGQTTSLSDIAFASAGELRARSVAHASSLRGIEVYKGRSVAESAAGVPGVYIGADAKLSKAATIQLRAFYFLGTIVSVHGRKSRRTHRRASWKHAPRCAPITSHAPGMSGVVAGIVRDPSHITRDPGAINRAARGIKRHATGIIRDRLAISADTCRINDDVRRISHDTWRISRDTRDITRDAAGIIASCPQYHA